DIQLGIPGSLQPSIAVARRDGRCLDAADLTGLDTDLTFGAKCLVSVPGTDLRRVEQAGIEVELALYREARVPLPGPSRGARTELPFAHPLDLELNLAIDTQAVGSRRDLQS